MKLHKSIFELEIRQRINYFFRKSAGSTLGSLLELTRTMTLLRRRAIHLKKSLTRLKFAFYETAQINFLSPKFDNVFSIFFVNQLDQH